MPLTLLMTYTPTSTEMGSCHLSVPTPMLPFLFGEVRAFWQNYSRTTRRHPNAHDASTYRSALRRAVGPAWVPTTRCSPSHSCPK